LGKEIDLRRWIVFLILAMTAFEANAVIAAPAPTAVVAPSARTSPSATPQADTTFNVLCYHRFIFHPVKTTSDYLMPVDDFRWQMQYLKDNGFTPISVQQLLDFWDRGTPLPPKPVLLTFDDGFKSVYEKAFPVMKEFHYPGILFLISSFVQTGDAWGLHHKDNDGRMALNDAEIREMEKAGLVVESHTVSHLNMGLEAEKRTPADFKELAQKELGYPVGFFAGKFGQKPELLAYPYGVYNDEVLKETAALYRLAFTVNAGPNDRTVDPYKLRRFLILGDTSQKEFSAMLEDKVLHIAHAGPGDGQVIWSRKPLISIQILDEVDPKSVVLSLESRRLKTTYDPQLRLVTYRVEQPIRMGGHQLTLRAKDLAGSTRVFSWYFRVKHRLEPAMSPTPSAATLVMVSPTPVVMMKVGHDSK
jgi:peptidoglycan/xylan/chitin deacetylase (PgdA/CDA1 family)